MTSDALYFERRGRGRPIVLLHGFTGSGRSLDGLANALAADRATISPDLPGHGRSVGGCANGAYGFDSCLARLSATLDAAGLASADWLGYSMGARLALGFAVRNPARVRSLVLVGGRAGIEDPSQREARRRADEALAGRIESHGVECFVDEWLAQPIFATQRRLGPSFLEKQRRDRLANQARELAASLRGLGPGAQPPLFGELGRVEVPVLLVAGALDRPFVDHARELARRLPRAEVCEIADAGHAAHLEQPAAFLAATCAFLGRAGARAESRISIPVEESPA